MSKVLVIDDNVQLLELYREVLARLGYEVLTADRGRLGLQSAYEHEPDCIILDIMMGDMDGLDALEELTQRDTSVPIIIITGFPSAENAIEALKRGAFDFLTKGCTLEEMVATTQRAIERRQLHLENQELHRKLQEANTNLARQLDERTAEVRELAEFNQSILEGIDAGLLAANDKGTILFANSSARRMLGVDQIIGQDLGNFGFAQSGAALPARRVVTPHPPQRRLEGDLSTVGRHLERAQRRATYRCADGTQRVFGYSISVPDHIPGAGRGYIILFRDVTEMEELRFQMQRLQKLEALNVVIAGVAHEIKNPLAGIKTVSSLLSENLEEQDPRREYAVRILEETRRVTRIIDDFFSFSRPSKPRLELFEVAECVGRVTRLLTDTARQKKIDITTRVGPDLPKVRADRDQIQQVILNLVMNAIEAIGQDGEIEISADVHDYRVLGKRCARIQVRDSGPGFPEESRHRLFDPFYTTKATGTGLGLHICQTIALQHGGQMEATNHPDGGALVTLFIPLPSSLG